VRAPDGKRSRRAFPGIMAGRRAAAREAARAGARLRAAPAPVREPHDERVLPARGSLRRTDAGDEHRARRIRKRRAQARARACAAWHLPAAQPPMVLRGTGLLPRNDAIRPRARSVSDRRAERGSTPVPSLPSGDKLRAGAHAAEALHAELFFLSPGLPRAQAHLAESRRAVETALRLDPSHPLALAVEMALPESASTPPPLERIRAAAARRPRDYRVQMLLAFAVGGRRPEERRAALVRAAALVPENAAVLNALAWHDLTHGRVQAALPV